MFVLLMFSLLLQESISFEVLFLCPCCIKIVIFSLFTVASNKVSSFIHLGYF
jgi:hypothetical protein